MKYKLEFKIIYCFIVIVFLCGCSTVTTRAQSNSTLGYTYSGVQSSLNGSFACSFAAFTRLPPALIVVLPLGVVDLLLTSIGDTLMYPIDKIYEPPESSVKPEPRVLCEGALKT